MTDQKEQPAAWVEPAETDATHNKILEFLKAAGITPTVTEHKAVLTCEEAAEVRGVELASGAKAMLIKDSGKKLAQEGVPYYLAILSASTRFNSKRFKKILGCKDVSFAKPEVVHELTGCLTGAVPPFGQLFGIPVYIDRSMTKQANINFNAGLRTKSISMSYADYIKAESEAKQNVFTDEEIELGDLPAEEKKEAAAGGAEARDAAKAARLAKRQGGGKKDDGKKDDDISKDLYGERALNRSQGDPELRFTKKFTEVKAIDAEVQGQDVIVRGRLHKTRGKGKVIFIVLRQQFSTIQCVLSVSDKISQAMVKFAQGVPKESIVEVCATVTVPDQPVDGCSQKVELQVNQFWVINRSVPQLPFQIDDASTLVLNQADEGLGGGDKEEKKEEGKEGEVKSSMVYQDTRLNNRIIDLRVPTNQAIFRIQAGVCKLFREFMDERGFMEIHSPKMIGGSSEGGANIFKFEYFGRPACLAQSPQLYKQMALMADFERVFEIGPVFRAENSNTNRHLCEFTGLDMEMTIKEHYFEVLDVLGDLLHYWCEGLRTRYKAELDVVKAQYPFEDFVCKYPVVKLHFKEGVKMLKEAGIHQEDLEDLSSEAERELGRLVKEKHATDFYMLYGYPAAARPFYTMLDPVDPNYTNSYDFFMRGEEITSGAQRIHDVELLKERATVHGIPHDTLAEYINSFKYGAQAHGGAGFGLERIVKFYCNLHNIRKSSMFPRDPKRIMP